MATLDFMGGGSFVSLEGAWTDTQLKKRCSVEVTRSSLGSTWLRTWWINGLGNIGDTQLSKHLGIAWGTQFLKVVSDACRNLAHTRISVKLGYNVA